MSNKFEGQIKEAVIDLETYALTPNAHILSIGAACMHDPSITFYTNVIIEGQNRAIDEGTLKWWHDQDTEVAQTALDQTNAVPLEQALVDLDTFWSMNGLTNAWGHGATFDISILEDAYRQHGLKPPWQFWAVRDTRTLIDFCKRVATISMEPSFVGDRHNALHDAQHEAKWMNNILNLFKQ